MTLRNVLFSTSAIVAIAGSASAAQAATLSTTFTKGAIAEYTTTPNQTSNAKLFSELNIARITISQNSDNGSWGGTQGNDTNVTVTLTKTDGSSVQFAAAINWLQKTGNDPDWIGLTISATTVVNDGYTLSGATQKTYLLEFSRSTQLETLYANGAGKDALDGSADTRGAFAALN